MKSLALLSGAATLLALATPSAAFATPPSTDPVPVLSTVCTDGYIDGDTIAAARGAGGRTQGFVTFRHSERCGDRIFYFEGSRGSWRSTPTTLTGTVVSVAADTTGTYLMYITPGASGTSELRLATRTTDGQLSVHPMPLDTVDDAAPQAGRGSLVARNGRWFAVWPHYTGTPGSYVLHMAECMFGGDGEGGAFAVGWPPVMPTGTHPVLTIEPTDGQPQLFWQRDAADGTRDILHSGGSYGAWNTITTVASGVTVSPDFGALDAAATAAAMFVTWTERGDAGDRVVVADNLPGTWRTSTPPAEDDLGSWDASIVASARTVFAAYGTGDGSPDGAFMAAKGSRPPWTATDASRGIPRSIDTFGVADLTYQGGGVSTALIFSGHRLYAVTR